MSCKKDKGIDPEYNLDASLEVSNVVCFPYDTTTAAVKLKVIGGKQPYSIVWDNKSFSGEGPHTTVFKKMIKHSVTITDANNLVKTCSYTIDRTSLDSLTYDYRNSIIGNYNGIITSTFLSDPNTFSWTTTTNAKSFSVIKHSDFNSILIDNSNPPFKSYNKSLKFTQSFYSSCSFKNDSMFFNQSSSHGVWYSSFKGKKIN